MPLHELLTSLPAVSALLAVVTAGCCLAFIKLHQSLVRGSEHRLMADVKALEAELASAAAASAPPCPKTCGVCGKDAPLRCKGCSSRAYCGQPCQLQDWHAGHKQQCKKLRAAAAAAAAARRPAAPPVASGAATLVSGPAGAGAGAGAAAADGSSAGSSAAGAAAESNSTPPVPKEVIFPYDRFLLLLEQPLARSRPVGLANASNVCFANSLLQALLATPPLAAYLLSGEHSGGCTKRSGLLGRDFCLLCDMEKLAQEVHKAGAGSGGSRGAVVNPKGMLRNIKRIGKQFTFGHQEDAHELYVQMLDCMEASMLSAAGGKAKFDLRSRETTLVHHIFGGYLRHQVACLSCGHVSKTYESVLSLPLDVPYRPTTLEALLQHCTASERLDGDNRYKCDRCKAKVAADRSTLIEVAPNILQVYLKRFTAGRFGGSKLRSHVQFPEALDLAPHMAEDCLDERPAVYSLYGVVIHQGGCASYGHYVAYVRVGDKWFSCNDESVLPVAAHAVLRDSAYMLFYQRQEPREVPAGPRASPPTPRARRAAGRAAAAEEAEAVAGVSVLGRIQTAPAALSHMHDATSGAAGAKEQQAPEDSTAHAVSPSAGGEQQGSLEELPFALPERFHPSVSESNLQQRGDGSSLAGGGGGGGGQMAAAAAQDKSAAEATAAAEEEEEAAGSSSEDEGLVPATNPFDLLGGSGDEADEPSEAPASVVGPADQPAAETAEPAGDARDSAEQHAAGDDEGPPMANGHHAAEPSSGSSPATSTAEPDAAPICSGHLASAGWAGEPSTSSDAAGRDSTGEAAAEMQVPAFRLEQKRLDDGAEVIRLSVDLPGARGEEIDLRVSDDRRQLWLGAPPFAATLALPAPVEPVQRSVKWVRKSQRLVAMFNVRV